MFACGVTNSLHLATSQLMERSFSILQVDARLRIVFEWPLVSRRRLPHLQDLQWGLCALRHGIQISMEAILACHPARSTEWLDCHPKSCEIWRICTGPIARCCGGSGAVVAVYVHVYVVVFD